MEENTMQLEDDVLIIEFEYDQYREHKVIGIDDVQFNPNSDDTGAKWVESNAHKVLSFEPNVEDKEEAVEFVEAALFERLKENSWSD